MERDHTVSLWRTKAAGEFHGALCFSDKIERRKWEGGRDRRRCRRDSRSRREKRQPRGQEIERRSSLDRVNQRRYACLLERKSVCPEMIGKFNRSRYQLSHTRDLFRGMESAKRFYLVSWVHSLAI